MKTGTAAKNRVTPIDAHVGRLPPQPTGLIGRAEELRTAQGQVLAPDVRLLTLIGPGGVGKTRLAVAVADSMRANPAFSDVRFVDLAPLPEPTLVPSAIARGLGAPQAEDENAIKALGKYLGQQRMLVVLDNFEHLLPAAADVGDLLAECPGLVVLATSREPLHLRWERTLPLGPLAVPDPKHLPALDRLAAVPAVTLFLERARAADPGFLLAAHNAAAVAELCVRLDGLPLAIELVAARAAQLGPAVVLERIARRLPLPASTMHDAPARQQTLRATLQWSVDLLDAAEQTLFRRVAAFAGGWSLDAAEAVGAWAMRRHGRRARHPDGTHIAGRQEPDPSRSTPRWLGASPGELRFRMLETAREFALATLEASGEADTVRRRHAEYFAALAEQAAPQLQGSEQSAVAARLEREQDNFRQALRWTLERDDAEALDIGLRLAGALGWFWFLRGYPAEARDWFEALLRPTRRAAIRRCGPGR